MNSVARCASLVKNTNRSDFVTRAIEIEIHGVQSAADHDQRRKTVRIFGWLQCGVTKSLADLRDRHARVDRPHALRLNYAAGLLRRGATQEDYD